MDDIGEWLSPAAAADFLNLSVRTLANLRSQGTGPRYRRKSGRIAYSKSALIEWDRQRSIFGP